MSNKEYTTRNIQDTTHKVVDIIETSYKNDGLTSNIIESTYKKEDSSLNISETTYINEHPKIIESTNNQIDITAYEIDITLNKEEHLTGNIESTSENTNNKCYSTCSICYGDPIINSKTNELSHNCIECIEGYYLMNGTKNCYNNETIEEGYYLDINENPYIWKKCYE